MIKIIKQDKEVDISLEYDHQLGKKPKITITGTADLSHHLIEGVFDLVDKLARTQDCCHRKEEYNK